MLYRTFLHLPGVSEREERRLWCLGVEDWWDFLAADDLPGISRGRLLRLKEGLRLSLAYHDDLSFLAQAIPRRHHWRLYQVHHERALFLDIETDGLDRERGKVTVIGLARGPYYKAYVAGEDLEEALSIIASASLVVTFGGAHFDLPFLRAKYPWLPQPPVHLDLCPLLRRLGFKGGLKRVERALGLRRPEEVEGLDGYQAVRLWRAWRRGNTRALERLVAYNREDVLNLRFLAEVAYRGLVHLALTGKTPALTVSSGKRDGGESHAQASGGL